MEPIASWSKETVSEWLKGLEAPLQQYRLVEWQLCGLDLLQLSSQDLERLGVTRIGHQELILEAVEKLCCLSYGAGGESLRSVTEKLRMVAHTLQMGIQSRWRVTTCDSATQLPANILHAVLDLITSAKGLFSLLNRYQLAQPGGNAASKSIISHCKDLGATVHKDTTVYEKEKDIIAICRQLVAVCDDILSSCPEALLTQTAQLESVDLVPVSPGDHLGIEITSTSSCNHYVSGTVAESPADYCDNILAGDEVIQVNNQIVVGWSRANLVKKLQENPSGVTLVLKKVPGSTRNSKPSQTTSQREKEEEEEEDNQRHSIFERVAASVRSLSFRSAIQGPVRSQAIGQEASELPADTGLDSSVTPHLSPTGGVEELERVWLSPGPRGEGSVSPRSPSPRALDLGRASISSCPEMGGHKEDKEVKKSSVKGMTTALSRRRVSCRELGSADCDGWLWKKRKDANVFTTQKWQRFWFVLKGPSLYWYSSPQEEKAEGLVQISSYNIESAGEHKRKNVFQMCHSRFQNIIFAAENVSDMSKWINCLIAAIQKHKKLHKIPPDSEQECYSETESEEEDSPSPRRRLKTTAKPQPNTLPRSRGRKNKTPAPTPPSKAAATPEDEMGVLFNKLKEGGVSLIGKDQPLTHDHFRKSFIRRNKNPVINEKAHTLRALQSTLKAKEAELQIINKVLDDSDLTADRFRQWKQLNEHLCLEMEKLQHSKAGAESPARDPGLETAAPGMEGPAPETAAPGMEGPSGLSFSDGEQLVDAEPSIPLENLDSLEPLEGTELSGSVSIETQASGTVAEGTASPFTENYFYI